MISLVIAIEGELPRTYGSTYLYALVASALRVIWKDRPDDLAQEFALDNIPNRQPGMGLGYSLLAEAYLNFGYVGESCSILASPSALALFGANSTISSLATGAPLLEVHFCSHIFWNRFDYASWAEFNHPAKLYFRISYPVHSVRASQTREVAELLIKRHSSAQSQTTPEC